MEFAKKRLDLLAHPPAGCVKPHGMWGYIWLRDGG
jgi:hypothetical protein